MDQLKSLSSCLDQNRCVAEKMGHPEIGQPGLARPKEFPRAPKLQVLLGNLETIGCLLHGLESHPRLFRRPILGKEDTF